MIRPHDAAAPRRDISTSEHQHLTSNREITKGNTALKSLHKRNAMRKSTIQDTETEFTKLRQFTLVFQKFTRSIATTNTTRNQQQRDHLLQYKTAPGCHHHCRQQIHSNSTCTHSYRLVYQDHDQQLTSTRLKGTLWGATPHIS